MDGKQVRVSKVQYNWRKASVWHACDKGQERRGESRSGNQGPLDEAHILFLFSFTRLSVCTSTEDGVEEGEGKREE